MSPVEFLRFGCVPEKFGILMNDLAIRCGERSPLLPDLFIFQASSVVWKSLILKSARNRNELETN